MIKTISKGNDDSEHNVNVSPEELAEKAIQELKEEGFDMVETPILSEDSEEETLDKEAMKSVVQGESPEEAFKRVSFKRINMVGKYLGLLENMAKQPNYSYTDKDVESMFGYIEEALRSCKRAYKSKEDKTFSW